MRENTWEVSLKNELFLSVFICAYYCYYTWITPLHFSILIAAYLKTFTSYQGRGNHCVRDSDYPPILDLELICPMTE